MIKNLSHYYKNLANSIKWRTMQTVIEHKIVINFL